MHPRRCYRYRNRAGGVAPLDVKLGIDGCFWFSPLMTFLICMLGAAESYAGAAAKLEAMLGFKVSSTAVQRTTEKTGERIPDGPHELIDEQRQQQPCSLMVVEVDGTTSPQITEQEGVTGLASLRAPTCYQECNLVVIEKHCDGKVVDRWTGGRYGPRQEFAGYAEQAGLRMGFLDAPRTLFLGDGARHNWDLQQTHFPGAIPILDYYHAAEHLADYCKLLPATLRGAHERSLSTIIWEGQVLQMIHEMKRSLSTVTDTDKAWTQINYFTNNQDRMDYARYRNLGWPIGSGLVDGQCKLVVGWADCDGPRPPTKKGLFRESLDRAPRSFGATIHTPAPLLMSSISISALVILRQQSSYRRSFLVISPSPSKSNSGTSTS